MAFRLIDIEPWNEEIPASPAIECQIAAYQKGSHADTDFFPDAAACITWAMANVKCYDKFYIYSNNWDYKIVGKVSTINGRKEINWKDQPIDRF